MTPGVAAARAGTRAGLLAGALAAALAGTPVAAAPEVYELDPEHSVVHFEVLHFGTATLRGRFGPLRGAVTLDRAAGRASAGLVIEIDSLSTGLPSLDARLREADLLDLAGHPRAYFVAEQARFDASERTALRGEFTLRGISAPLELQALRFGCAEPAGQPRRCGGDFEATLLRSAFGASYGVPFVADRVRLRIQVEGLLRP